ncbi:MAG TPA: methyltransferase domain-containing protein [Gaiellaceae bacterium]|nr:methyltransferase domain-containing protein [Gaiellaceae bacterium]
MLNDPAHVREEYSDESRFSVRASAWANSTGPNTIKMCRAAVAEVSPRDVLEVGSGRGETAEWIARETGAKVVAVAAWMLYHVADLDRGLAELRRVLRPNGRLVATTNSLRHGIELKELVGAKSQWNFNAENGEEFLHRHFSAVERRDADGYAIFQPEDVVSYIQASKWLWNVGPIPQVDAPIRVTRANVVFVATR